MSAIKIPKEQKIELADYMSVHNAGINFYLYNEEEYKEVFVHKGNVYAYDIYREGWFFYNYFSFLSLKEGFYNYRDICKASTLLKQLNKNYIYLNTSIEQSYLVYNKELEVWESIRIENNKATRKIYLQSPILSKLIVVDKKLFNKLLLVSELVS